MTMIRAGVPLSNRLFWSMHEALMEGDQSGAAPGQYRRIQNWIGGRPSEAAHVPPPVHGVADCMAALERFLNESQLPVLLRAGLARVQFETIHPFLDGNGRIGRMLISLALCEAGVLREPLLYLSLYLKRHRQTYYQLLNAVREDGDWEAWLRFFCDGVRSTADGAARTASDLFTCSGRTASVSERAAAAPAPRWGYTPPFAQGPFCR